MVLLLNILPQFIPFLTNMYVANASQLFSKQRIYQRVMQVQVTIPLLCQALVAENVCTAL